MRILTRKKFQDDMAKAWSEAVEAEYKAQIEEAILAEREACAELRNKFHPFDGQGRQEIIDVMNTALDDYQAAIRARGISK